MSDEEEVTYVKKQNTIHYGSLEESERIKQQALDEIESDEDEFVEPEPKKIALAPPTATPTAPSSSSSSSTTASSSNNHISSSDYFNLEEEMYDLFFCST